MIKNHLTSAWRNIKKDRFFSLLNIIGLGFGIATCLLIIQYLRGEWNVDKHHTDYEQVYQINTRFDFGGTIENYATGPSPLANKLVSDYPEVQNATRLLIPPGVNKYLLKKDNVSFFESKGVYADKTFFSMFTYPFIEGSPENALQNPNDVVISETLANKFFNGQSALGKSIEINTLWGDMTCNISGVIKTDTYRSHLDTELFVNMETGAIGNRFAHMDEWAGNNMFHTYIKLTSNANAIALEQKFPVLIESTAGERLRNFGFSKSHTLITLKDIHLKSRIKNALGLQGNITYFYIFAAIGAFILIIACINFMNLSTAKSSLRAKEVAVKKVLGAQKSTLALQFFTETLLFVFLSLIVAIFFIVIGQAYLQNQMNLQLTSFTWSDWELGLWILSILTFTSFLAGSYPALMLSSFSPMNLFNGKIGAKFSAVQVRKILVITQFVISIMLIQGIMVVKEQMNFIKNGELGYSQTEKIVIPLNTENASNNAKNLKQKLSDLAIVSNVGISSTHPGLRNIEDLLAFGEQKSREENVYMNANWVSSDFITTMGFELLNGRNFKENDAVDSYAIVTESALAGLGYTLENTLNKKVRWQWADKEESVRIVGVIKDFHFQSLKDIMKPQIFFLSDGNRQAYLVASLNTTDISKSISSIQTAWKSVNTSEPFEFYFMDDKVQSAYESDIQMSSLIMIFTILAILISCLGLIGLSAFAADRRKKEIGIRKVLGASIGSVVQLLSKEFIWLVLIAIVIATPIAWYFTSEWLGTFHYKINMPWHVYAFSGIIAVLICIVTVSFQSIKATLANPIKSLRTE